MKIAFDHQIFAMQSYGGVSRYFVRLAEELIALGEDVDVLAPLHRNRYLKELPEGRVYGMELRKFPPKSLEIIHGINRLIGSRKIVRTRPNILHETYFTNRPFKERGFARILTVYDMIHEKYASNFSSRDQTSRNKRNAVDRADHVICISHSTKRDLCALFDTPEEKVSVVHLGFERFEESLGAKASECHKRPYLLYVGYRGGYKNFSSTLHAVASDASLINNFDVVAFGGGRFNREECALIKSLGFRGGAVRQVGGDDIKLSRLYRNARAFVYPSLYEGFGLPPLEAMGHDCPVVSSDTSSMPEVIGPAGEYFDPTDMDSQANAIRRVVFDSERQADLVIEGRKRLEMFSWAHCAEKTQEIYRSQVGL